MSTTGTIIHIKSTLHSMIKNHFAGERKSIQSFLVSVRRINCLIERKNTHGLRKY